MYVVLSITYANVSKHGASSTSGPCIRISCMKFSTSFGSSSNYPFEADTISSSPSSSSFKPKGNGLTIAHHVVYPLMVLGTMDTSYLESMVYGSS